MSALLNCLIRSCFHEFGIPVREEGTGSDFNGSNRAGNRLIIVQICVFNIDIRSPEDEQVWAFPNIVKLILVFLIEFIEAKIASGKGIRPTILYNPQSNSIFFFFYLKTPPP